MTDHSNIIPFDRLKNRDLNDPRATAAADPILEKLKHGDCSREWCPVFARNLGDMATHLDPAKPMKAARRMFEEAFGQTAEANWRKRKRYLRFPGEETPFLRDGDYAASNGPYLNLAAIYAKLHLPADRDGPKKANRLLVKGTSLGPPVDVSKIDGITQALECLKRIQARCVMDLEIVEAYSYLSKFPIAPFAADGVKRFAETRDLSIKDLTATERGNGLAIVPVSTSTVSAYVRAQNEGLEWYRTHNPDHIPDERQPWYVGRAITHPHLMGADFAMSALLKPGC